MSVSFHKPVAAMPAQVEADAIYALRRGDGFDLRIADSTGSIAHDLNAVDLEPAAPLTTPFAVPAVLRKGDEQHRVTLGHRPHVDVREFGAVVRAFGDASPLVEAQANLVALQAALDWSSATGGVVSLPAGQLNIHGPATLPLGAAIRGAGQKNSRITQAQVPASPGESWQSVLVAPAVDGNTGGNGYNLVADLTIDGGWNMRDHLGGAQVNWAHDPARMTAVGLSLDTPQGGPPDGAAVRGAGSDAQSRILNVTIQNVAGRGLQIRGRGENFLSVIEISRTGTHGL